VGPPTIGRAQRGPLAGAPSRARRRRPTALASFRIRAARGAHHAVSQPEKRDAARPCSTSEGQPARTSVANPDGAQSRRPDSDRAWNLPRSMTPFDRASLTTLVGGVDLLPSVARARRLPLLYRPAGTPRTPPGGRLKSGC